VSAGDSASPAALAARLDAGLGALGQDLGAAARARLLALVDLLARWNRSFNLTAVRDRAEMIPRHLLDSLAIRPFLGGETLLDVGTGAGFPGLPLAIAEPERSFWLLDSQRKKLRFVQQAVLDLGLDNVQVVHARFEAYQPGRNFSTIVSRAVAARDLLDALHPDLLARPGRLLLMQGRAQDWRVDLPTMPGQDLRVHGLRIPFLDAERHLIELRST
jgi:16S rRNA (guanine527-N7)-methyltransferase